MVASLKGNHRKLAEKLETWGPTLQNSHQAGANPKTGIKKFEDRNKRNESRGLDA